ncbi:MAG: hypothetical protein H6605_01960 [Flavobacteriales bacterium]|nr:hypothetical protein [Flavobacteriales bacterium]
MSLLVVSHPDIKKEFSASIEALLPVKNWHSLKALPLNTFELNKFKPDPVDTPCKVHLYFIPLAASLPDKFEGMVFAGVFRSFFFYNTFKDIERWILGLEKFKNSKPQNGLVMSMMKPFYLKWADKICTKLQSRSGDAKKIQMPLPEDTTKDELGKILSTGAEIAVYTGHGRSRGWSGYRGFRWSNVQAFEQTEPIGAFFSFSCESLSMDRENKLPFLLKWILSGRMISSLAAYGSIKIRPLEKIVDLFLKEIEENKDLALYELILKLDSKILELDQEEVRSNWKKFLCIGNPMQSF